VIEAITVICLRETAARCDL